MFLGRNKREKIAFSIIYKSLFISAMTKENEDVSVVNKSSYTQEEINTAYEKSKNEGRIEGMLAYQKRLIDNLKRDNVSLNQKFQKIIPHIFTDTRD